MVGGRAEETLEQKYRAWSRPIGGVKPRDRRIRQFRGLARQGIVTVPDVLANYDSLHRRTQRVVLQLVGFTDDRRVVPLLARVFRDDPGLRSETLNPLSLLGGKRAYQFTRSVIEAELAAVDADPALLEPAFWALVYMIQERSAAHGLLLDVFAREGMSASVRSTVLDFVGADLCSADRRTSIFRRARRVVLHALADPEEEVRFFAIYAAGQMALNEALPRLQRMARTDRGTCRGLWTVAQEAQDVISHLTTGWWPDREPRTGKILDEPPV